MTFQFSRAAIVVFTLASLTGCANINSQVANNFVATPDGIVYYAPRRPFVITITADASGRYSVTATEGLAEPDLSKRFVLSQATNIVAKNEMNITVGASGLLKSGVSTSTSEVTTAVQNLASAAGTVSGLAFAPVPGPAPTPFSRSQPPPVGCPSANNNYTYLVYPGVMTPQDVPTLCGYAVTWQVAAGYAARIDNANYDCDYNNTDSSKTNCKTKSALVATNQQYSGLFYRHELPYLVTITSPPPPSPPAGAAAANPNNSDEPAESQVVLTSPDQSEIDFFPIKRSFFAANTATITLKDGVITGVDQTTDGELTAAASLPASVLSSYMSAIGSIFSAFTTNSSDVKTLLVQQQQTALAQAEAALCKKTIAANQPAGNATPQAQAQALAAIKAACTSN